MQKHQISAMRHCNCAASPAMHALA